MEKPLSDSGTDGADTPSPDVAEAIRQVQLLCSSYRNAVNKEYVLKRWLTGSMEGDEFYPLAKGLHLKQKAKRAVYLIRLEKKLYPEVSVVLKNIFPNSTTWLVPIDSDSLVILYHFPKNKEADIRTPAYEFLSALNTELMEQAVISCSNMTEDLSELPEAYNQALLAMDTGSLFHPNKMIYCYQEIGLGHLIIDTSKKACQAYIREKIGERFLHENSPVFESDILQTALCFLDNDLNIAETSRQLHVHRNTLLYRLEQIQAETGLDIRHFEQAMTYKICSMILVYL
jgi:carbohydrate diacid regulator